MKLLSFAIIVLEIFTSIDKNSPLIYEIKYWNIFIKLMINICHENRNNIHNLIIISSTTFTTALFTNNTQDIININYSWNIYYIVYSLLIRHRTFIIYYIHLL